MAGENRTEAEKLKALLGVTEPENDVFIEFALNNAKEIATGYCCLDEIPEGLSTTVLRMAMDIYRNEQPGNECVPMAVKSISEGDTNTSFGVIEEKGYSESILKDYRKQLNRFRRLIP